MLVDLRHLQQIPLHLLKAQHLLHLQLNPTLLRELSVLEKILLTFENLQLSAMIQ
jgi:hypothetical protein